MANGDTKTESYLRAAAEGTRADLPTDNCCNTKTQNLILGVANRIMDVEDEVEELKNNPDVVDIVDTYADLQAYDTSTLTDKDIIRVLEDSTHDNKSTYYRWNASTNQFDYIGEAGGGVNVVQTTGTSTTDVMSQDATTKLVYTNSGTKQSVNIGGEANDFYYGVAIGKNSKIQAYNSIAIGSADSATNQTRATSSRSVSIGYKAYNQSSSTTDSVALGSFSYVTRPGEVNIGCEGDGGSGHGYNSTNYRVLGGVHDPVDAHDAATKGYVDANAGGPTVVQTTGTSTTDVMSQDATTKMITLSPNQTSVNVLSASNYGLYSVSIGNNAFAYQSGAIAIGGGSSSSNAAYTTGVSSIAIGGTSKADGADAVAIGYGSAARKESTALGHQAGSGGSSQAEENVYLGHQAGSVNHSNKNSVAIGHYAQITRNGELSVGSTSGTNGYNSTGLRVIGNVYDGQLAQDAVTVSQVNNTIDAINTALGTSIPHIGA